MNSPAAAQPGQTAGRTLWVGCVACLLIGLVIGHVVTYHWMEHHHVSSFSTPYQAVLLSNGAVYYGKLSGYGTQNSMLTDVFYILSKTDPNTKQVTNILVKRGKELHGPDRMYLNPEQIVFVEPVGPDSKVAQLIHEASQ
jgi:small nuclear ribonucleoprotein (snRNP)-like protein